MVQRSRIGFRGFALAVAILGIASGAFAQSQTGNVYGSVKDEKGEPLPGVTLTLSGGGAPSIQVSDAQGQFRFIGIYPGTYKLEGALQGFSPIVYPSLIVNLNRNTTVELAMSGAVEETITITAESPLLDARKISTGATIDKTELEKIPTARDPWVILQTTPGVLVDRVNVGGNESGQQSTYVGNGDDGTNSSWSIDGVEITDFGAIGSSASYYDFDAFEELQVTTGGSDAASRTGGVGLNLVTKRGTNEWRGSGRYIVADQDWQSDFNASESDFGKAGSWNGNRAQTAFKQGNRIVEVLDYGFELGGPILKDKLWIWGSYGENDIKLLTVADVADDTLLETWNTKLNWQVAQNNSATAFFSSNDKTKQGRNAGPTRPQETTWNQGGRPAESDVFGFMFGDRPTVAKIEDTHIFGSNFFLTGSFAESDGGFELVPQGGSGRDPATQTNTAWDGDFIFRNTFLEYGSIRPQDQWKADASYFFSTGNLNHELKFGANWREATVLSNSFWPGFGLDLNFYVPVYGYNYNIVQLSRESEIGYVGTYTNGYIQDTITTGNLTANIGFRYDKQEGKQLARTLEAVAGFEDILPQAQVAGKSNNFTWEDFSPRLGLTYALGEEKKTLLRFSYSRFAEQLGGLSSSWANPGYPGAYVYMYYRDTNADGHAQVGEVARDIGILFTNGSYNPFNPSQPVQSFFTDPNLNAPVSDEIVVGVEHALLPEFVIGLTATWRNESDILEAERLVFDGDAFSGANITQPGRQHTASDYVVSATLTGTLPSGEAYAVPIYGLRPGVSSRGGTILTNGDREREYLGVSFVANKRLSNNWMMRGNVTWNDWEWKVPTSELDGDFTPPFGGGFDGDRVLTCSGTGSGSKAGVCISSAWSYSVSGMYQVMPDRAWGFNVAASLNGREGYANPYWIRNSFLAASNNTGATRFVSIPGKPDDYSNDDIHILDLRVEKEFKFDRVGLTLGADVFNVMNEGTVLQRQIRLGLATSDHVQEVVSPRIFRLGAKLSFN
jgi:hypothetical protein